jgi:hypothetical protein
MMSLKAVVIGLATAGLPADVFAGQTIKGVIPPGRFILNVDTPNGPIMHFRFYAPRVNAGVAYAITFCIGPPVHPCGRRSRIINVPEGQMRSTDFVTRAFFSPRLNNVLTVGQGTGVRVPFMVEISP